MFMEPIPKKYKPKIWEHLDTAYPNWKEMHQGKIHKKWINVDMIVGTASDIHTNKWFPHRFFRTMELIESGEYDFDYQYQPVLFQINNRYFVASDGNHRCLAFKFLKVKK